MANLKFIGTLSALYRHDNNRIASLDQLIYQIKDNSSIRVKLSNTD